VIRISISEGGKSARLLTFSKLQVTIGRDATHDLPLTGQGVSGSHCRLVSTTEGLFAEDLGSTNGTFVNRQKITGPTRLSFNDEVVVARYRIQVLTDPAAAGAQTAGPATAGPGVASAQHFHPGATAAAPGGTAVPQPQVPQTQSQVSQAQPQGHPHPHGAQTYAQVSQAHTQAQVSQAQPQYPSGAHGHPGHSGPQATVSHPSQPGASGPNPSGLVPLVPSTPSQPGAQTAGPATVGPTVGESGASTATSASKSPAQLEWAREWEQIDKLATAWFAHGRQRKGLLRGKQLSSARKWLASGRGKHPAPKSSHREFIRAGVGRRRLQIFARLSVAGVVLGGAAGGGLYAYRLQNPVAPTDDGSDDGVIAEATLDVPETTEPQGIDPEALASTALTYVESEPDVAALLAAHAAAQLTGDDVSRPDHPVAKALRRSLERIASQPLLGHLSPVAAVAVAPNGRQVATSTKRRGEPVRLWDLQQSGVLQPATLSNHAGRVKHMSMTDDGHWLLTADDDGLVMRWDLTSDDPGSSGVRMDAHTTAVVAMHLAGQWLVTADTAGQVRLWNVDVAIPRAVSLRGNEGTVTAVAVAPDGSRAASTSDDGTGRIWTIVGGVPKKRVAEIVRPEELGVGPLLSVAISPDGRWVLTGASDGTAWLWKAGSAKPGRKAPPPLLGQHKGPIQHVGFSRDGTVAYTAGSDDKIVLWDMTRDNPTEKVIPWAGHTGDIKAIDVTGASAGATKPTDGAAYLLSASADGTARRWNLDDRDGAIEVEVLGGHRGVVNALDASVDGRWVVTGGEDLSARVSSVWRKGRGDRRRVPGLGPARVGFGHAKPVRNLAMNGGSNRLVTASDDGTARVWDLVDKGRFKTLGVLAGHPGPVTAIAINKMGKFVATGSGGGDLRLWELGDTIGEAHLALQGHRQDIRGLAFTDQYLVSVSTDGSARLWDMRTADPNADVTVLDHGDEVVDASVSGNGKWLLTALGTQNKAMLWDLSTEDPAAANKALKGHADALTAVELGPKGRWAATGGRDYRLLLYDLNRWEKKKPKKFRLVDHEAEISAIAFAPSGRAMASADANGNVWVWNLESKRPKDNPHRLEGPTGEVRGLSWSGDSRWVVAGSDDRGIYLWEMGRDGPTGEPVVLAGHEGVVSGVAIARDATFVVSGGFDGTARQWPLGAPDLISLACNRAGRWLTQTEWADHVGGPFVDGCPR